MHSPLHQNAFHESAIKHVSGQSIYVDDLPKPQGLLVAHVYFSPYARARILSYDLTKAKAISGVKAILTAKDIPGHNDIAPFTKDEPLLAEDEVFTEGQAIFLIVAENASICREASKAIQIEFEKKEPILSIQEAIQAQSFHTTPHIIQRGIHIETALESADFRFQGKVINGGQDHFYLETQCALAIPQEDECFLVYSSTQHPSEVQAKVAEILDIGRHQVVVESGRMGGGFGGKETQAAHYGALASLGAYHTGRPVKLWLNRDQDMVMTGKRHPFFSSFDAGFSKDGKIVAIEVKTYSNGGWACDLSGAILDRCMFHLDGSYWIPNLRFEGRVCKTNLPSNTAFRGFGGPQGALIIEEILNQASDHLGLDPTEMKFLNFYEPFDPNQAVEGQKSITPYGQIVKNNRLHRIYEELMTSSHYQVRKAEIDQWNATHRYLKKGIAFQPVKFGISFTNSMLNQAGALVLIYADGTIQLNHGGTEMGQGLYLKMLVICAHELGVPMSKIRHMKTATDKVPNTSATAASSGADLNGQAVKHACDQLKERLKPLACKMLGINQDDASKIIFENQLIFHQSNPHHSIRFEQLIGQAYVEQISLSAVGYYRTPNIHYDRNAGKGKPFHYFAFGGSVTEVEVNVLTGEHRVLRADILHDAGHSLVPNIDIGQVQGAYIQGLGWLTREELYWNQDGILKTHSPDTYKIPTLGDAPLHFHVRLLDVTENVDDTIHGSKAVGEPPFLHGIGVLGAIRHAIGGRVELGVPATPEAVLKALS